MPLASSAGQLVVMAAPQVNAKSLGGPSTPTDEAWLLATRHRERGAQDARLQRTHSAVR